MIQVGKLCGRGNEIGIGGTRNKEREKEREEERAKKSEVLNL